MSEVESPTQPTPGLRSGDYSGKHLVNRAPPDSDALAVRPNAGSVAASLDIVAITGAERLPASRDFARLAG